MFNTVKRKCSTCRVSKPLFMFHRKGKGYRYKCKECQSEYVKEHYKNNKQTYLKSARKVRNRNRKFIQNLKESTPCADCGIKYPYYVMDFDHKTDKLFNIARFTEKGILQIKEEIKKCDIVCSNCHRIRTHSLD